MRRVRDRGFRQRLFCSYGAREGAAAQGRGGPQGFVKDDREVRERRVRERREN